MAYTVYKENLPEEGDKVEKVEVHESTDSVDIFFESGAHVIVHLANQVEEEREKFSPDDYDDLINMKIDDN